MPGITDDRLWILRSGERGGRWDFTVGMKWQGVREELDAIQINIYYILII